MVITSHDRANVTAALKHAQRNRDDATRDYNAECEAGSITPSVREAHTAWSELAKALRHLRRNMGDARTGADLDAMRVALKNALLVTECYADKRHPNVWRFAVGRVRTFATRYGSETP